MILSFILCLFIETSAFAHGNKPHGKETKHNIHVTEDVISSITKEYEKKVQPIFKGKCFDCHSSQTEYPWYYQLPIVSRIMDSHIKEARSHIDMTKGYPFAGHGGPIKDLEEVIKVTKKDEMPPWYYTPFHKDSKLSDLEKEIIIGWSKESLAKLRKRKDKHE